MRSHRRRFFLASTGALLALLCTSVDAATFTVNSVGDAPEVSTADGVCDTGVLVGGVPECTLRAAIQQANATAEADAVQFNIPGAGVHVIQPASELPESTGTLTIDGYTQPGAAFVTGQTRSIGADSFTATLRIRLDGSLLSATNDGLRLSGANSSLSGLSITGFRHGLVLAGTGATVTGNYVGTAPDGSADGNGDGVSDGNGIQALGDGQLIVDNVVSNNKLGIATGPAAEVVIRNNLIGTAPDGLSAAGNGVGVLLADTSAITVDHNLISANDGSAAIELLCGLGTCVSGEPVTVTRNLIGTDLTGLAGLGNSGAAVRWINVHPAGSPLRIGGPTEAERNVISANGSGILIADSEGGVTVQNNFIGTGVDGATPLGNDLFGILVFSSVDGAEVLDNTIANNGASGIEIGGFGVSASTGIRILNNSITGNVPGGSGGLGDIGLGIDLGGDGVTHNDPLDADTGPNGLQNFPIITNVIPPGIGTSMTLQATLNTQPLSGPYTVEFFSLPAADCDPQRYGEGGTRLAVHQTNSTDAQGAAFWSLTGLSVPAGHTAFTATATGPEGTSEFSPCFVLDTAAAGDFEFGAADYPVDETDGSRLIAVGRVNGTSGAVSVDYASASGTATTLDYTAVSGTLDFADGSSSATFSVPITDDDVREGTETLTLTLSNPTGGAGLGSVITATVTINDNEGSLQVFPDSRRVEFGTLVPGEVVDRTVTLSNTGSAQLSLGPIFPPSPPFGVLNNLCATFNQYTLNPGSSCTFDVRFAPSTEGRFEDHIDLSVDGGAATPLTLTGGATTGVDLTLTKNASTQDTQWGDTVGYTLGVTNHGPVAATGVAVRDVLPDGLTLLDTTLVASQGTASYDLASREILWSVGDLADSEPDAGASLDYTVVVDSDAENCLENTARISAADQSLNATHDDTASLPIGVGGCADIEVVVAISDGIAILSPYELEPVSRSCWSAGKQVTCPPPFPNTFIDVTYMVTVKNLGPTRATNVQRPERTCDPLFGFGCEEFNEYVSVNPPYGLGDGFEYWAVDRYAESFTGTLEPGEETWSAFRLRLQAANGDRTLTHEFAVTAGEFDPDTANNVSADTVEFIGTGQGGTGALGGELALLLAMLLRVRRWRWPGVRRPGPRA